MDRKTVQNVLDWYKNSHTKETHDTDIVKVIRCKDCIYHTEDDECTNGRWNNWSNSYYDELYPEALEMDYCSYGVRKDG